MKQIHSYIDIKDSKNFLKGQTFGNKSKIDHLGCERAISKICSNCATFILVFHEYFN